jgi:hypothetical protein
MAKSRKGLDGRHHDKSGRIERKHGNTKVTAVRKEYGKNFAEGRRGDLMLKSRLKESDIAISGGVQVLRRAVVYEAVE